MEQCSEIAAPRTSRSLAGGLSGRLWLGLLVSIAWLDYVYEQVYQHMNISNLRLSALNLSGRLCTLLTQEMCGRAWTLNDYQIQPGAIMFATSGALQPWSPQPPFYDSDTPVRGRDRTRAP